MEFLKYQHVERFGSDEVENINIGTCFVFPKIDGTNASIWFDGTSIHFGKRSGECSLDNDNACFFKENYLNENYKKFFDEYPNLRLFGEWLVPHSLKTYKSDAWRKFYVFDVMNEKGEYLSYEIYKPLLEKYNIDYIPCIATVKNGSYEQFINIMNQNNFLIEDGNGIGEGIIVKRYDYVNKYGRTTWAKIVTSEFKEKHVKEMGGSEIEGKKMIEEEIVELYLTEAFIEKTFEKIKNENNGWTSKYIPQLLSTCYHDFIIEELWGIVKGYKNPKIDFKTLLFFVNNKIKKVKNNLF